MLKTVVLRNGQPVDLDLPDAPKSFIYAMTLGVPERSTAERLQTAMLRPSRDDAIVISGERRQLIASSFGAPIPMSGPEGPGDALVSGIVGDLGAVPGTLSISGPGWTTLTATISVEY